MIYINYILYVLYSLLFGTLCYASEYPTDCDLDEHNAKYCKAGYYLAKTNTKRLVDKTNNIAGDLYECIGSNTITCKKIPDNDIPIGYLINQDSRHNSFVPIITCSFRDQKRICYPIAITKSSCGKIASSKVATGGSIFKNNNKFDLCLDGSMTATKDVTTARYLMEATTNLGIESIYGNYIAASIDKVGNIKIDLATDDNFEKYQYVNSYLKIVENTSPSNEKSDFCEVDKKDLIEFIYNEWSSSVTGSTKVVYYEISE